MYIELYKLQVYWINIFINWDCQSYLYKGYWCTAVVKSISLILAQTYMFKIGKYKHTVIVNFENSCIYDSINNNGWQDGAQFDISFHFDTFENIRIYYTYTNQKNSQMCARVRSSSLTSPAVHLSHPKLHYAPRQISIIKRP